MPDEAETKLTLFLHHNKRSHPCAGAAQIYKTPTPGTPGSGPNSRKVYGCLKRLKPNSPFFCTTINMMIVQTYLPGKRSSKFTLTTRS